MSLLRTTFFAALLALQLTVTLSGHHEMLGDNLEDVEHADARNATEAHEESEHGSHEHHTHGYLALCFLMFGIFCGAAMQMMLDYFKLPFPYTVTCFIFGIALSLLHDVTDHGLGALSESIELW